MLIFSSQDSNNKKFERLDYSIEFN